mgnify:CR=1 FL=1
MNNNGKSRKIVLFTCNWHALNSLEAAGIKGKKYPVNVIPIRISCLGRITPGLILKAFEGGAGGVCLAGCPEGKCRYQEGNLEAYQVFEESKALIKLLGYDENLLLYTLLPAGDGTGLVDLLENLVKTVEERNKSL